MASMRDLAMQLVNNVAQGFRLDKGEADSYLEVMDRSPYGTGVPLSVGYGENEMSPLDMSAIVTAGIPIVGDVTGLAADVDMYMRDPESRNIPNYLLTAAGALPFIPAASQVRKGIKAYHGSPHNFDKFSAEQIGTGEGAQAYGRGLYFTETEDVAKGYKGSTNYADKRRRFQKELPDDADVEEVMELVEEGVFSDDLNELLMALEADDWLGFDYPSQAISASLSGKLKNYDPSPRLIKATESGSMYEVNIDVAPDELLDWDKPMAEQSLLVKQAFNFDPPPKPNFTAKDVTETGSSNSSYKYSVGQFPAAATIEEALSAANKPVLMHTGPTGSVAYKKYEQALSDPMADPSGAITAAQKLQEKGIKGIKYADAFTRHKTPDKRSMNYVIFDDRLISISKKYGIAIPVAAALLAKQTGEDTSQSYQEI